MAHHMTRWTWVHVYMINFRRKIKYNPPGGGGGGSPAQSKRFNKQKPNNVLETRWAHHRLSWKESIRLRPRGTTVWNWCIQCFSFLSSCLPELCDWVWVSFKCGSLTTPLTHPSKLFSKRPGPFWASRRPQGLSLTLISKSAIIDATNHSEIF